MDVCVCAVCCVIHTCHDVTPRRPPEAEAALLSPPLPVCDATIYISSIHLSNFSYLTYCKGAALYGNHGITLYHFV